VKVADAARPHGSQCLLAAGALPTTTTAPRSSAYTRKMISFAARRPRAIGRKHPDALACTSAATMRRSAPAGQRDDARGGAPSSARRVTREPGAARGPGVVLPWSWYAFLRQRPPARAAIKCLSASVATVSDPGWTGRSGEIAPPGSRPRRQHGASVATSRPSRTLLSADAPRQSSGLALAPPAATRLPRFSSQTVSGIGGGIDHVGGATAADHGKRKAFRVASLEAPLKTGRRQREFEKSGRCPSDETCHLANTCILPCFAQDFSGWTYSRAVTRPRLLSSACPSPGPDHPRPPGDSPRGCRRGSPHPSR